MPDQDHDAASTVALSPARTKRHQRINDKIAREGKCRLCGHSCRRLTRHHLVPMRFKARQFSRKTITVAENIVPLCEICHKLVETKDKGGGFVHRARLRAVLRSEEIEFVVDRLGRDWLDFTYPAAVETR